MTIDNNVSQKEMMRRLAGRGRGRQVRIEFELLSIDDMRDIAREMKGLAVALGAIAKTTTISPFERLCLARDAIYNARMRTPARQNARNRREVM